MTLPEMTLWPGDLRLRLPAGLAVLLLLAPLQGLAPAAAGLCLVLLLLAVARQRLPWHRLWHLEAFLILLLLTLPFTVPGQPLLRLGPVTASAEGLLRALTLVAKVSASVLLVFALFADTAPENLGAALRALRLPEPLVRIFLGLTRYLSLIRAEMARLQEAMRARSFRPRSTLHTWRSYGFLIGMMLIRALERSERIMKAMKCRGFTGRLFLDADERIRLGDAVFVFAFGTFVCGLVLWEALNRVTAV
jgi:cobalt/nickel transport system permease protein